MGSIASLKNRPTLEMLLVSVGAGILYGIGNYFSGKFHLPGSQFIELRPQIVIPMFIGFRYGPLAGFIAGCVGDRTGYALQGLPFTHAWNWSIGNGFIGMTPGLARYCGSEKIKGVKDFAVMLVLIMLASSLPIVFAAAIDAERGLYKFSDILYSLILPAFITDAVFGFILLPPLLILTHRLVSTIATRTLLMVSYLLIFTVLFTYGASTWEAWRDYGGRTPALEDLYNIGILSLVVLAVGLSTAALLTRKVTRPVVELGAAAAAFTSGDYSPSTGLARVARRADEIGHLARALVAMAQAVAAREEKLQQQVAELKIEIDRAREQKDVAAITDTDYFQKLKQKAKEMREQQ